MSTEEDGLNFLNLNTAQTADISESRVVFAVRWRYRIHRYLIVTASIWVIIGGVGAILAIGLGTEPLKMLFYTIQFIGFGLLTAALAVQLAIFRCPVCDHKINWTSWKTEHCSSCGVKIR